MLKALRCSTFLLLSFVTVGCSEQPKSATATAPAASTATVPNWGDAPNTKPSCIRGIHLTAWATGSQRFREKYEPLLAETELNTVVIDIKESHGEVYIPGVELDGKKVYTQAVKDMKDYVKYLKDRGIYVIARQVVFHDNHLAKVKPDWAVRSTTPLAKAKEKGYREDVWVDRKGSAWADPTNPKVWDYNIAIALKAADLGFQEIQFDYIRFPSDGPTKYCVYHKQPTKGTAVNSLVSFLSKAREKLAPKGVEVSIDTFGLTGSSKDDMGIGQKLDQMVAHVDTISPMMYPSHYYPGEYGLKDPNSMPYETILRSVKDTRQMIHNSKVAMRPWLQDFSLGVKYTARHVRAQIEASADMGVHEWLLWNPKCNYTKEALHPFYKPIEGQPLRPQKEKSEDSADDNKSADKKPADKKPSEKKKDTKQSDKK